MYGHFHSHFHLKLHADTDGVNTFFKKSPVEYVYCMTGQTILLDEPASIRCAGGGRIPSSGIPINP